MSIPTELLTPLSAAITTASRNQELLDHRDAALLTAYRIAGNVLDAEDILQDAYVKAVRTQTPLITGLELRKWFMQVTANAARDWLRGENRRRTRERNAAMEKELVTATTAGQSDLKILVESELSKLDEKFRAPISLHYEQGFTYEEASEILGVSAGSLRVYASQGLKQLRERLDKPARPVTEVALLALLGTSLTLTASPALAASVKTIVATGVPAAKVAAVATGAKIFTAASTNNGLFTMLKIGGAAAVLAVAVLGALFARRITSAPHPAQHQVAGVQEDARAVAEFPPGMTLPEFAPVPTQTPAPTPAPVPTPRISRMDIPAVVNAGPTSVIDIMKRVHFSLPAQEEAQWQGAVELLPLIDPQRDAIVGAWSFVGKDLVSPAAPAARVAIPYLPPDEYDYRIDFTRMGGGDLNQIFSMDGLGSAWRMGTTFSGYHFGMHENNPDRVAGPDLMTGLRYTCIVKVRRNKLAAYVDGVLVKEIVPGKSSTEIHMNWRLPDQRLLGVGVYKGVVIFHRIAIREITGKGKPVEPDPYVTGKIDETQWEDARSIMPKSFDVKNVLEGEWSFENGQLSTKSSMFSRYQINYAAPEEYDMRVEFIRTEGIRDVAQILRVGAKQVIWKLDSVGVSTLDTIDGKYHWSNPHKMITPNLIQNGRVHTSIVSVRKNEFRAYLDGRLMFLWHGGMQALDIEGKWHLLNPAAIGVGAFQSSVTFTKIQVIEVSGTGRELTAAEAAPSLTPVKPPSKDGF